VLRLSASWNRVVDSVLPIIQIVAGATGAYAIAHFALGHATPLLAATVTISTLGFVRDARPVRVLESAIGIVIGIALSELLLTLVGRGVWQIALVLAVTLLAARFLSSSNAFAVAAGVQSMLVVILPPPVGGPFQRSIDGLIGGAIALLVTALIPRDPRRLARRDAKRAFGIFTDALASLAFALEHADESVAERALERLRSTQPVIDAWSASLDSAAAIARISPFLRRHTPELAAQARVLHGMDLAIRNLRVIARRIDFLVRDGVPRPAIASLLSTIATSVTLLGQSLDDPVLADNARVGLSGITAHLRPKTVVGDARVTDSVVILMLRPMLVDLLTAAGLDEEKARGMLPEV
jgi:uncharacterized membrane protein YgaE (UPF0421/DUF939 family)